MNSTICPLFAVAGLAGLICVCTLTPGALCGEPVGVENSEVSKVLQPFVDRHALAGAVTLVATKDRIVSLEAVGWADVAGRKPLKTDALFWIASQSKPITCTALMILVDEGKVHLDDPVEKYLPEFRKQWLAVEHDNDHQLLKHPSHPITVREILSHTSGLPFSSSIENPTLDQGLLSVRGWSVMPYRRCNLNRVQNTATRMRASTQLGASLRW